MPISTCGIQQIIDPSSAAIKSIYDAIGNHARQQDVNAIAYFAHLIREAKALTEFKDESTKTFGLSILEQPQLLCHLAQKPPYVKQWPEFYSELLLLLMLHEGVNDLAGELARTIAIQESLCVFLDKDGFEPTNNRSECALRFAVLWRKRSHNIQSDKGNCWVERILSLKQTCRMQNLPMFPILADAIDAYFKDQNPD
jgi:transposase